VHQLRRGRPVVAGMLLSVGCIKPQLIWMVPVMLLIGRGWRGFVGMALGTAVFLLSAVLILGDHLLEWPTLMFGKEVPLSAQTAGLPGLVGGLAGSAAVSVATAGVLAVIVIYAAWHWRRRLIADPELALIVGIGASLLLTPHVFSDDFLLLAVPLVAWAAQRPRRAILWAVTLSAAYLVDLQLPAALAHLEAPVGLAIVLGFAHDRVRGNQSGVISARSPALSRQVTGTA
jgi:hypothetical protein